MKTGNSVAGSNPKAPKSTLALVDGWVTTHEECLRSRARRSQRLDITTYPGGHPMEQLFAKVGLPEGYYFFRYASHAVHTSRLALWARIKEFPTDG